MTDRRPLLRAVATCARLAVFLMIGCSTFVPSPDPYDVPSRRVETLMQEAGEARLAGRTDEALALYREAIQLAPRYIQAHREYQDLMRDLGKVEEAREEYRRRLQEEETALAWCLLGRLEADPVLREFRFRRSVEMDPGFWWGHFALACHFMDQEQWNLALGHQLRVRELRPDFVEGRGHLADIYRELGRWSDAAGEYRSYLRLRPQDVYSLECLAGCLVRMGKLQDSMEVYEEILQKDVDVEVLVRCHVGLAAAALRQGEVARARRHLESAMQLDAANPEVYYNLGVLAEVHEDRPDLAIGYYEKYLELGGTQRSRVRLWIQRLGHTLEAQGS